MPHGYEEYERKEKLWRITACPEAASVNVIFVHGLGGGAVSTWDSGADSEVGFWPKAIADDHPEWCVWTLHYTARIVDWNPFARSRTIDLLDRAAWFVELMTLEEISAKPIVFVAHSLGGVLVKQVLQFAHSLGPPRWRMVWEQTQAVIFLATPHVGSELADVCAALADVMRGANPLAQLIVRTSPAVDNLKKDNPILRHLSDWFRDQAQVQGIETIAFAEGRPCMGKMVVSYSSANPQIPNVKPIILPGEDHISIAKPADKAHPVYKSVSQCLERVDKRARAAGVRSIAAPSLLDNVTIARVVENRQVIARVAGAWWENIVKEQEGGTWISFFRILPDRLFNSVFLDGQTYNGQGAKVAEWKSVIARVEREQNKVAISYLWKGRLFPEKDHEGLHHGFGFIEFSEPADADAVISRGGGRFWDVDEAHLEKTQKKPMEIRRVKAEEHVRIMITGAESEISALVQATARGWRDL